MTRTCVIDLPGLSRRLLDRLPEQRRPTWLLDLLENGAAPIRPVMPAVTMPAHATYTTGVEPARHGIIANGLPAFRDAGIREHIDRSNYVDYRTTVSFWEQSTKLLQAPRVWADDDRRVAMLFMQSSMGGAADIVVTPKPEHTPDGRTISLCWSSPDDLYGRLESELGAFPLKHYWGPLAGMPSSEWIIAAAQRVWAWEQPDLQWVYVPHMDYCLQTRGPAAETCLDELAAIFEKLTPLVHAVAAEHGRVILLSDYGITPVSRSVAPNVLLRREGLLTLNECGEVDYAHTPAFALCDHQVSHIYCRDSSVRDRAGEMLRHIEGVGRVYVDDDRASVGLDSERAGQIVVFAAEDAWFEYRWWDDWGEAPDYAWTVDIHRKPGYDPTEMTFDMERGRIRADEPGLIRGSHGRMPEDASDWPVLVGIDAGDEVEAREVAGVIDAAGGVG